MTADLSWLRPGVTTRTPLDAPRTGGGRVDLTAFVRAGGCLLFESAPGTPGTGDVSYVVIGTAGTLEHDGTTTRLCPGDRAAGPVVDLGPDPFAALDDVTAALHATPDDDPGDGPDFVGGLAGAWAYDLGRRVEDLPARARADRHAPWMDLRVVTDLVAVDHRDETAWRIRRPVEGSAPGDDDATLAATVRAAQAAPPAMPLPPDEVHTSLPPAAYRAALAHIADRIAAGDVFQVNLAQRLSCRWRADAAVLYERLRGASPAPYGALFVRSPGEAVASVSPEGFLHATGREVVTRPIKGTRPRAADPIEDAAARDELVASAKDRAENVMVVDMERNDLGRVCRPGSVHARDLLVPEAHPTVWHLVSTIAGTLRPGVGWGRLLRATFPSGSVTGTPKVAAMGLIDHLEPVRRSWYCGSLGWLGPGSASLSVAIRTAVLTDGVVDYSAGGGIVADSDADAEMDESWAKAAAFLDAVGADTDPTGRPRRGSGLRTGTPPNRRDDR